MMERQKQNTTSMTLLDAGDEDIPCKNCICIPVCRLKDYYHLHHECSIIFRKLYLIDGFNRKVRKSTYGLTVRLVEKYIRPLYWKAGPSFYGGPDNVVIISNPPPDDWREGVLLTHGGSNLEYEWPTNG
jgi:hypothetical protein